jgi:hypothetical protein
MNATAPVTVNGQTYPVWQISLAISQTLKPNGDQPISFALRCVPARLTGDETQPVQTLDSGAVSVYRGSEAEITDPAEAAAFAAIQQAVVAYLVARGL